MTAVEDRRRMATLIGEAHAAGARLGAACAHVGIDVRTLQRWTTHGKEVAEDRRPVADRPTPAHALSADERTEILRIANQPEYAALPPAQIVPRLADEGRYIASESTFHRVLREHGQSAHPLFSARS